MTRVFRVQRIEVSETNRNNPYVFNAIIEQRYNILFGLFHYWNTPSFAPPHLDVPDNDGFIVFTPMDNQTIRRKLKLKKGERVIVSIRKEHEKK